jgi:hypothetical protein
VLKLEGREPATTQLYVGLTLIKVGGGGFDLMKTLSRRP